MPKLKTSERDQKNRAFQGIVSKQLIVLGYNKDQLAKMLRISRSTLWGKLADPASFRLGELLMLYHILKFTDEEKQILL